MRDFRDIFLEVFGSVEVGETAEVVTTEDVGVTVAMGDAADTVGMLLPCC